MKALVLSLAVTVVFWNVENFFDCREDRTSPSEMDFTPMGKRHWTVSRFNAKCNAVAKTILHIADSTGRLPDIVAFAEIENSFVLRSIISRTALNKFGYRIIHYATPDKRGIGCGVIYRPSTVPVLRSGAAHISDSSGVLRTRDILIVETAGFAVLVNHHPSKVGKGGDEKRKAAMERMGFLCDSLEAAGCRRILCIGDFNDDVWKSGQDTDRRQLQPTIKYNGKWEKIDGVFTRNLTVQETVWNAPYLTVEDKKFGGVKPLRTYNGLKYLGGVSDHYPVVVVF